MATTTVLPQSSWELVRNTPAFKSGVKFDVESVTVALHEVAEDYAEQYKGTFSFMLQMQDEVIRRDRLSVGQAKGVLNCMAAELRRANKPQESNETAIVSEPPVGYFTLEYQDGVHATIRVSKARGQEMVFNVAVLVNGGDFARCGKVDQGVLKLWKRAFVWGQDQGYPLTDRHGDAIKALLGALDVTAFGLAYARRNTRCYRCDKMLTDPESMDRGLGPECSRKGYTQGKKARAAKTQERIDLKGGRTYRDIFQEE